MSGRPQTCLSGHYSLVSFFFDFNTGNIYEVSIPQFTVKKDMTVSIDARQATSAVSVTTPKPADPMVVSVGFGRTDALGQTGTFTFLAGGTNHFFAQPTAKKPSVGQLHYYVYSRLYSPSSAKKAYTYDLDFPSNGTIPADQSFAPAAKKLQSIAATYPADHTNQPSLDTRFAAQSWQTFLIASDLQFTAPMSRTEYYSTGTATLWQGIDFSVYDPGAFTLNGEIDTGWTNYTAGAHTTESWRGQPTHPRLFQGALFAHEVICPVCATASNLDVLAFPFSDNTDTHHSWPDGAATGLTESLTWAVKAGKTTLTHGSGLFDTSTGLVSGAKAYPLTYNETRSSADFLLSTNVTTSWKVMTNAPETALPTGWACSESGDTSCSVLPLMTQDYQLPVDLLGRIKSGDVQGTVTVSHLAGANIAVKKLTTAVSFDGGTTYTAATVTPQGNGQYTIAFTVPPKAQTNGFGALKISATDKAGGTLNETIVNAFAVK